MFDNLTAPYIIADVGSNWVRYESEEKNLQVALQHIRDAKDCGASAVKFQYFTATELYGFPTPADKYSLPLKFVPTLAAYCTEMGVDFMCTAFSEKGIKDIDPFVNVHKIASAENKHIRMLETAQDTGKMTLVSLGCAHQDELKLINKVFPNALFMECIGAYPAPWKDYNLTWLKEQVLWGLSDHTLGNAVSCAALGAGATIFEKHFNAMPYSRHQTPDEKVSMDAPLFKMYCETLKALWPCMQHERKMAQPSENEFVLRHRRRLKALAPIKAGEALKYGHNFGIFRSIANDDHAYGGEWVDRAEGKIALKDLRPGNGIGPSTVDWK